MAKQLGAAHTIDPNKTHDTVAEIKRLNGGGVTHALDTTGLAKVITSAAEVMLPNGMLGLLGMCAPDAMLSVSLSSLMLRGVGIKYLIEGDSNPQEFIPRLTALYQEGKFPFDRLIKKYAFDQINEAAHASETGESIKPVLVF